MYITKEAKELLENVLSERGIEGIRLYAVDEGDGPQIALALEDPHEFDRVQMISGIKVAFDPAVTGTEVLTLDKEESQGRVGIVLQGPGH